MFDKLWYNEKVRIVEKTTSRIIDEKDLPPIIRTKIAQQEADFEKIQTIIADQLGINKDSINSNDRFVDDLGADSLDIVELIMRFEDEFGMEIPDEEVTNLRTIDDVFKYLHGGSDTMSFGDMSFKKREVSKDYVQEQLKKSGRDISNI